MVIQKTALYKILAIVLVFVLLVGSSERVEAAELPLSGTFEYNGVSYPYYYTNQVKSLTYNSYFKGYNTHVFTSNVYLMHVSGTDGFRWLIAISDEPFIAYYRIINTNGGIVQTDKTTNSSTITINNKTYYTYMISTDKAYQWDIAPFSSNLSTSSSLSTPFFNYVASDSFDDLLFSPNWAASGSDPLFMIQNMQADIVDGNIVVTWEPIPYMPFSMMENMYIRFGYANRTIGTATTTSGRNRYQDIESYAKMSDCGITIPISDLNLLENRYVSSILATPYYYIADNLENDTVKGKNTVIYFDEQGVSSTPIIVEPEVEDEIPIENTEQNIFYSIQNFFSGFFRNLTNTIKTAVVPSGDDVLALLQEMNDWFSVRFGFIWYPFDLALDIMAAFALGEPDSKITVPALTLNMFGGVKLWDEFQADLDPIDFLKYVRFFTSTIICCGTVSLAIRKWDEWIGGRSS